MEGSAVRIIEVLAIPPMPMRATGASCCAKLTILLISLSRPKKTLGRGGSPGTLDRN